MGAFLDTQILGHLALAVDGAPHALPMLYAREGGTIFLHGSTGSGSALLARGGRVPAGFTVHGA